MPSGLIVLAFKSRVGVRVCVCVFLALTPLPDNGRVLAFLALTYLSENVRRPGSVVTATDKAES